MRDAGERVQLEQAAGVDGGAPPPPVAPRAAAERAGCVVLDTSVLVFDPEALFSYAPADVVVPLVVVEELDGLKSRSDDVGRAAREAIRSLEALRTAHGGDLRMPAPLPGGGTLRVETNGLHREAIVAAGLSPEPADHRILAAALGVATGAPGERVRLESNDAALRIKAAQLGLEAREYQGAPAPSPDAGEAGAAGREVETGSATIDALYRDGSLPRSAWPADLTAAGPPAENDFQVLRHGSQSALCRHRSGRLELVAARRAWGLEPRSKEQRFALDLLLDPEVDVVALDGVAGTGKTVLALAAGLEQCVEQRRYETLAVYRPVVPVGGSDVGYLPGTLEEKLGPWMAAVLDAVTALTRRKSTDDALRVVEQLTEAGVLSLESVTFLRGRSLQRSFVLVDEAQNLEPTTLKTILTRVGEGTKVVFTGDTSQIDAPYLSATNNAIRVLVERFAGHACFGHVRLAQCERSEVAALAARLL